MLSHKENTPAGRLTRQAQGVRCSEEEFRGEECRVCVEVREAQMSQMQMSDFNVRRLGWRTYGRKGSGSGSGAGAGAGGGSSSAAEPDDSDGGGYCW